MEKHNVSRLIGAPPGYVGYEEGGQLTEKIRRRPYAVVLLDEIEKAHPDVFNMLLQIMEEGRLTDSFGRNVDFKNTIIIMTTNVGAEATSTTNIFGFDRGRDDAASYETDEGAAQGRDREVLPARVPQPPRRHHRLPPPEQATTSSRSSTSSCRRSAAGSRDRGLELVLTDEAKEFLIDKGYNPDYGARPLRRAIENLIEDPLTEEILRGTFKGKDTITVTVEGDDETKQAQVRGDRARTRPRPWPASAGGLSRSPSPRNLDRPGRSRPIRRHGEGGDSTPPSLFS